MAFQGNVALVTGGGSGMGQRAAQRLADGGAKVAILDVNEAGMTATAEGSSAIRPYKVDISNTDEVQAAVASIEQDLGPIGRVVNAAAIMPFGKLLEQDPKVQLKMMDINYGGLVNVASATLPGMVQRGAGDFLSFSSMSGIIPGLLMGGYCSSKAAVSFYTEILYHENRDSGVRFCCICPPPVSTPLWNQAKDTVVPQITQGGDMISADEVLDAVEKSLEKGDFYCFPGKGTKVGYIMRRLFPNNIWKYAHKAEGF